MLDISILNQYAKKFLRDNYNLEMTIPLTLNGRLKSTKGRFVSYVKSKKPKAIELNKSFVMYNEPKLVLDVLRHELVHYALFMQDKPNGDGHPVFEGELKRLGIISQGTINNYKISAPFQFYKCGSCNKDWRMTRRLKHNGIYHRCKCGGGLIDKGKKVVTI